MSQQDSHQERQAREDQLRARIRSVIDNTDMVSIIDPLIEGGLRQQGQSFVGLCPFHSDSNPSFSVTPSKGVYRCWSCSAGLNDSAGGDIVTFVRRYYNKSFMEACEMIAQRAGISLRDDNSRQSLYRGGAPQPTTYKDGFIIGTPNFAPPKTGPSAWATPSFTPRTYVADKPEYETTHDEQITALKQASDAFTASLAKDKLAQDYLFKQRGITPELAQRYSMGYAPKGFNFLEAHVVPYHGNTAMAEAGLIKATQRNPERFFDVFRDRVLFGVRNKDGDVVGFGGRLLNEDSFTDKRTGKTVSAPKYLNSPESLVFQKSELLFGFYESKDLIAQKSQVIVVEGYMDVMGLASHGVDNAVSCMGVAVSETHVNDLADHAGQIVMCFDGDRAGQQGAVRSLQGILPAMGRDLDVRFLLLPEGQDPDDYIKEHGKPAFEALIENSLSLLDFIDVALQGVDRAANQDTSPHAQSAYERKLAMIRRWIGLSSEGSAVRQQLAQKGAALMQQERGTVASTAPSAPQLQTQAPGGNTPPDINSSVSRAFAQAAGIATATNSTQQMGSTRGFSRQGTKQNPSSLSQRIETSVEQRVMDAIMASPHAAKNKRDAIIAAANAAPDEHYDALVAWVSWYDNALTIAHSQPNISEQQDKPEGIRLVYLLDRIISTAASQGQFPKESDSNKLSERAACAQTAPSKSR